MSDTPAGESTAWWAKFTLIGGVVSALLLLMGPIGYRLGVLDVQGAVLLAPGMAASLGLITVLFALVGVVITLKNGMQREKLPVLIGGVLGLAIVLNMALQFSAASAVPPIHDITTDPEDPPRFAAVLEVRGADANPLDYDAGELAELTREAYPEVAPIVTDTPPSVAFDRARVLVEQMGWELVDADARAGRIEATDTTLFYGFEDDVVIRLRPAEGGGTRIDLRSVSRVGQSDLGANAARIRAFIERFEG
jgi:uncharacterized protein (DUF1499 family)